PHLDARDNVTLMARRSGWDRRRVAERVGELSRLVHLSEDELDRLPSRLSGGQRQRLAIARAIAADPHILILDDCLSAVDSNTEHAILENLRRVFEGRTGIIISHRVRALRDCDAIVVLDGQGAADYGTHEELVARPGYYQIIAREQLKVKEPADRLEEPAL
ncbi:MAG: ATP-binding cassette domain-containing protein, partial [Bradymonadaceae bacterium]